MRKIYLFNGEVGSGVTTTLLKFAAIRNTENTLLVDLNSYTLGHKEKMCTGAVLLNAQYVNGTAVDIEELMMQIDNAPTVFIDCGCKRLLLPKELYCSLSQRKETVHCQVIDARDYLNGTVVLASAEKNKTFFTFFTFVDRLPAGIALFNQESRSLPDNSWISRGPEIQKDLAPWSP